jgi:uncharacterized protein (TIGR00375 family)
MKFIADFHLHSRYSRATSPRMDLENLAEWAQIKGIKVLGTADFTHPYWFKSLKEELRPAESGLFEIKGGTKDVRFILTAEISCIYSKKGRVRKIHILILVPSLEAADKINLHLGEIGNLSADGRPILGLDAKELAKIILNVSEECMIVPGHVMTPWFGIFGSKSGFDSVKECFDDYSKHIFALETGLSASPSMIWRIPDGQRLALISNSDAHSPANIGREANVFDTELSYPSIIEAIKTKNPKTFIYTIEFFPQEGKYHYDGHRACNVSLKPSESKKYNNICPNCQRPLTIGVLNRIEQLAEKPEGFKPGNAIPFKSLVPLREIIAEVLRVGAGSKKVGREYRSLIEKFGSEFEILLNVPKEKLEEKILPGIAEGIIRVREGKVFIRPGYDGVYGKVSIFSETEQKSFSKQKTLF